MPPHDHRPRGPHHPGPHPPRHHGEPPHTPGRPPTRGSLADRFVDHSRVDALLAPWVPDAGDRAFVVRCLLDEGPAHHRGANWVLLSLLGELAAAKAAGPADDVAWLPLRLPPQLSRDRDDEAHYPLPLAPLRRLAGDDPAALQATTECLLDGPPQHALANAAMVCFIDALLRP